MITEATQKAFIDLIGQLQSMRGSERRSILSKLDRSDRASVRRIVRSLKSSPVSDPVTQLILVRLERASYSDGLKRHLRRLLGEARTRRPVTAVTQAWLARYLSSGHPAGTEGTGPAQVQAPPALKLASVTPDARPLRSAG